MTQVEAIFHDGVFQPVQEVKLPENQRVRLSVEPVEMSESDKWRQWLAMVQEHRQRIVSRRGILPDSTPDIAEDRNR